MEVAKTVYDVVAELPSDERFGLTSQIRRSAISIPSNIAEGSKRRSKKDFIQFLRIAGGSAAELETQLLLADEIYGISAMERVYPTLNEVQKMIESLAKKL